jgi:hypothetical protein
LPVPEPQVMLLTDLEVARSFPAQMPLDVMAPRRSEAPPCLRCRGPMKEVLLTTGGPGCDHAVWVAHPLAVDGWYCPACSEVCLPRSLEPEEALALLDAAVLFARRGRMEDAELSLRRVTSSWPRFAAGRVQLALLYGQRLARAEAAAAPPAVVGRLAHEIVAQLDDVLAAFLDAAPDGESPDAFDVLTLACRALLRQDDAAGAIARIDRQLAREDLRDHERESLEELRRWVEDRGDLDDERARRADLGHEDRAHAEIAHASPAHAEKAAPDAAGLEVALSAVDAGGAKPAR